ncbi:hypothetical protein AJ88_08095 [Mesorhizobium amorphae CCBAU 01583]|nr:hypothetical protein AJ88_08095 [Mesorhizobium amorphae CCBAU 01583]
MVPDPGRRARSANRRDGARSDEARGVLDGQSEPGALAGRHLLQRQPAGFHRADGEGYRFFGETVLAVEKRNPQVAARLATALRSWRSLEPIRQAKAREALLKIASAENLSADLRDIVERTLA